MRKSKAILLHLLILFASKSVTAQTDSNSLKIEINGGPYLSGVGVPNFRRMFVEHSVLYDGTKNVGLKAFNIGIGLRVSKKLSRLCFLTSSIQRSATVFKYYPILIAPMDSTFSDYVEYRPPSYQTTRFNYSQLNIGFGVVRDVERFRISAMIEYGMRKYDEYVPIVQTWSSSYRTSPSVLQESFRTEFQVNSTDWLSVFSLGLSTEYSLNNFLYVSANVLYQYVPYYPVEGSYHIWEDRIRVDPDQEFSISANSLAITFGFGYCFAPK